ncbi:NAD(P)-dependent alcohol dehydrogenase [Nocardia crassostreae]|uniref:NAD(P)-dependent alcohol dehydrogenase n=1 Tax=Nocardia crassostreae TaxID=53428 RepID=UPI000ADE26B6|nr:NAD(P)-dependent alcohol dehydrogenase [Nocardia crassostreae]
MSDVRAAAATMTAVIAPSYGTADVLHLERVAPPVAAAGQVLVRVRASSVCKGDIHLLHGTPYLLRLLGFGVRRPRHRVIGHCFAGVVTAVGPEVREHGVGDEVYGEADFGAFAEFVAVPVERIAPKPAGLGFEEAAAVPDSAITALQGLRDSGALRAGQSVLINGASGGVGTFAVQLAKAFGAGVTAVCSTRHLDAVRGLGADHVIDYTATDFTRGERRYDIVFDLAGNRSLAEIRRILHPDGVFISSAGAPGGNWLGPLVWMGKVLVGNLFTRQSLKLLLARPNRQDLLVLNELISAGAVAPLIEHRFPFRETAAAIRHVEQGHAQGKTVITCP